MIMEGRVNNWTLVSHLWQKHSGAICAFFVLSASISARIVRVPLFVDMCLGLQKGIETLGGEGLDVCQGGRRV